MAPPFVTAVFPLNTQFVSAVTSPALPARIAPALDVETPLVTVTSFRLKVMLPATLTGCTSKTRSTPEVCWIVVLPAPAPYTVRVLVPLAGASASRSPIVASPDAAVSPVPAMVNW